MNRTSWLASSLVAVLAFTACSQAPTPQAPAQAAPADPDASAQASATNGLTGVYYDNVDFTGTNKTRVDATINKNFGTAAPITGIAPNTYSVRWTGQIQPKYSETYTFTTTADDGVRLMVNGQVLVNNWVNQGPTTKSGTVSLQAGVKYDIRLEYSQNTGGAQIKLEWQSPSQAKQVVPTANLWTTGSNFNTVFQILTKNQSFQSIISNINYNNSAVYVGDKGDLGLFSVGGNGIYYIASIYSGSLEKFIELKVVDNKVILTDDIRGGTLDLGDIAQYVESPTNPLESINKVFISKSYLLFSLGSLNLSNTAPIASQSLHNQGFDPYLACQPILPPPPGCDDVCGGKAVAYRDSVCANIVAGGFLISEILGKIKKWGSENGDTAPINSDEIQKKKSVWESIPLIGTFATYVITNHNTFVAYKDYQDCINDPTRNSCPPLMAPIPASVDISRPLGYHDTLIFSYGSASMATKVSILHTLASFSSSNAGTNFDLSDIVLHPIRDLSAGEITSSLIGYTCPNIPTSLSGLFSLFNNASNTSHPQVASVTIHCGEVFDVTQPAPMSTYVNAVTTTSFSITGTPGLNYTISPPTKLWLALALPASGTIPAGGKVDVQLTGTCPSNPIQPPETDTLTVTDTASGVSKLVTVSLECKPIVLTAMVNGGGGWYFSAGSDSGGSNVLLNCAGCNEPITWQLVQGSGTITVIDSQNARYTAPLSTPNSPRGQSNPYMVQYRAVSNKDPSRVSNLVTINVFPIQVSLLAGCELVVGCRYNYIITSPPTNSIKLYANVLHDANGKGVVWSGDVQKVDDFTAIYNVSGCGYSKTFKVYSISDSSKSSNEVLDPAQFPTTDVIVTIMCPPPPK